jgi:hypothetical protein
MKIKSARIIGVLLIFILLKAYSQAPNNIIFFYKPYTASFENNLYAKTLIKFNYYIQYKNLKDADVAADLKRAIMHNDYRSIAISGNAYVWPGLDGYFTANGEKTFGILRRYERYLSKYKFKVIEGTSDDIYGSKPDLQDVAEQYANKYNQMLLKKLGYSGPKSD